jgi:hypothetical protein
MHDLIPGRRGFFPAGFAAVVVLLLFPSVVGAHLERPVTFPDPKHGSVPRLRGGGRTLVVCKPDSRQRIERALRGPLRKRNLALLKKCAFADVQAAVNAAKNETRILVLPGVYREEPSLMSPSPDPACGDLFVTAAIPTRRVPGYGYQRTCPNDQNLIAIVGDSDGDGRCDDKCNIQISGTARRRDVRIVGDRRRLNVIRADRADGVVLRNFTIEYSDFNNVYVIETNGFRLSEITSRWSREYGFLTFASDHGLYERLTAYGNGDSGIYPGSGPEGHCRRYGIEIRNVDSYANNLGLAGTAGNGLWIHDSRFHGNAAGLGFDSLNSGHPGMPQDCTKIERNRIYSNNLNVFTPARKVNCHLPYAERNPRLICPTTATPVGTGLIFAGGNNNLVRSNWIYDNWRWGVLQFWVPPSFRGEPNAPVYDTSNGNRYVRNRVGVRPGGTRAPNGLDFWWDEEGSGNCWSDNRGYRGHKATSNPKVLPACPRGSKFHPPDPKKFAYLLSCASWNPVTNPDPPGCTWLTQPPRPK